MKKLLLILTLICMIALPVYGQTGTYTTHNLFYLPEYGAYGLTEYNEYNAYMEIADLQIWANKTDIAGIDLSLYYLKTEINTQAKIETIWGVNLANDSELHTQNTDTDLDATFEATFVKKTDTVNVLSDITSLGANIEDAVTKKHTQNTDTDLDATFEATFAKKADKLSVFAATTSAELAGVINNETGSGLLVYGTSPNIITPTGIVKGDVGLGNVENLKVKLDGTTAPGVGNDNTQGYAVGSRWVDVTNDKEYVCLDASTGVAVWTETTQSGGEGHTQNTDQYLDFGGANQVVVADAKDAVTKKHAQNTDTIMSIAGALNDHEYLGKTDSKVVGENVVFGDLLYFDWTDGEWMKAKADVYATARSRRIALETKGDGEACLMLITGYIRDDSAFEFTTATVFLSITTAGATQSTVPSVAGNQIQVVGTAISADIMEYSPSMDVGEI